MEVSVLGNLKANITMISPMNDRSSPAKTQSIIIPVSLPLRLAVIPQTIAEIGMKIIHKPARIRKPIIRAN